jgi:hypothetical protein
MRAAVTTFALAAVAAVTRLAGTPPPRDFDAARTAAASLTQLHSLLVSHPGAS